MKDASVPRSNPSSDTVERQQKGPVEPRMPHERDESADSQASEPRQVIKQAHDDVVSGQENTDLRGSRGKRETSVPTDGSGR